ncbi:MAG: glycogen/starch/alpha-glucan phosphorylase, partial [Clostridia bacterium]|nr:glycogen/starch/alpha-glucan phosphorylase [Clostridia bacterium]
MTTKRELETICGSSLEQCTNAQLYRGLVKLIANHSKKESVSTSQKKVYYISAEFLTGRLLINNLHNLGLYNSVKTLLHQAGRSLEEVSCEEPEPSLGNGGLGRLAACFLDSIASLGLPGDGIGLCYHLGLFRQVFAQRCQTEQANPWRQGEGFLRKTGRSYPVAFKDRSVVSTEYELDVIGAGGQVNTLHLFDLDTVDPGLVTHGIDYDKTKVEENLTLFLYPDDRDEQGRYLRLYQQYFMVSNGAQLILEECEAKGCTLYDLPEYAVIQINDTHPALIIPELIRLLCHRGIPLEKAADIVTRTCAYTNHTVLAEALETWPLSYLEKTVPALVDIVKALNQRVKKTAPENPDLWIIDAHEQVHMARLAVHYTFSTNGVAALHTHILKNSVLKPFYTLYPQRFNNKTNGISFRRWLTAANPLLDELIGSYIGDGFRKDPEKLEKLLAFREDEQLLKKLLAVKQENKKGLQGFLEKTQGVTVSPDWVFDVQIKRLHEYKRQQLNLLYYIHQYFQIKQGRLPK